MEACLDPDCRRSLKAMADLFALQLIESDMMFRCGCMRVCTWCVRVCVRMCAHGADLFALQLIELDMIFRRALTADIAMLAP